MEDFRISNYLARDVEHFGQERAEQGAEVSADGGEGGSMGADHYDFEEEQQAVAEEKVTKPEEEQEAPDEDTTAIALAELDRIRLLGPESDHKPDFKAMRGRYYYTHQQQDPLAALDKLPTMTDEADNEAEDT